MRRASRILCPYTGRLRDAVIQPASLSLTLTASSDRRRRCRTASSRDVLRAAATLLECMLASSVCLLCSASPWPYQAERCQPLRGNPKHSRIGLRTIAGRSSTESSLQATKAGSATPKSEGASSPTPSRRTTVLARARIRLRATAAAAGGAARTTDLAARLRCASRAMSATAWCTNIASSTASSRPSWRRVADPFTRPGRLRTRSPWRRAAGRER
jgi:hypothetical protein